MALVKYSEYGNQVPTTAPACPKCEAPIAPQGIGIPLAPMQQKAYPAKKNGGIWHHPLSRTARWTGVQAFEVTPFVFNGRLYRLENHKKSNETANAPVRDRYLEDSVRIRDVETDQIIAEPLTGFYFGIAFVYGGIVHVIAGKQRPEGWWRIREAYLTVSRDLRSWSEPVKILEAQDDEHIFNFGLCHDGRRFVLLYETDDRRWPKFTFKYCESSDLRTWRRIKNAFYGTDKYVGGPALYYYDGWYYTLFLNEEDKGKHLWATRLTRSLDLRRWEDAPDDRTFLYPNATIETDPERRPGIFECNASDAELCVWNGGTLVYFCGGDQYNVIDLQEARFNGPPGELLAEFFV